MAPSEQKGNPNAQKGKSKSATYPDVDSPFDDSAQEAMPGNYQIRHGKTKAGLRRRPDTR